MNIKSLLLGSAAALVAISGARAADAVVVVAEPEPMEYVRVCDTYGAGFYYIPGTETCLKISGKLRYDIDYNDKDDVTTTEETQVFAISSDATPGAGGSAVDEPVGFFTTTTTSEGLDEGWAKTAFARLEFDARSETEYGLFRRYIRLEASVPSGADSSEVSLIYAYAELGGLLVGLYDTLYDYDFGVPEFESGGGSPAHQIRYTFDAGNGISLQASLEEQDYNYDYQPNFGAAIHVSQGWGGLHAFGIYDSTTEEFGIKAAAVFNASDAIIIDALATYESGYGDYSVSSGADTGYEFSGAAAVTFKATDKLAIAVGGQYFANQHDTDNDDWVVGGNINYMVVDNMMVQLRVAHTDGDTDEFTSAKFRVESNF